MLWERMLLSKVVHMRLLTAGESHGTGLVGILEGLPAGVPVDPVHIDRALAARQTGTGRGERMNLEKDQVTILGGVAGGMTFGAPVCLMVTNRDDRKLAEGTGEPQTIPRPGHADLAGCIKYGLSDLKLPAERASARISAIYVAFGTLVQDFMSLFGIRLKGYVKAIGGITASEAGISINELEHALAGSSLRCPDRDAERLMIQLIGECSVSGDSLGGLIRVVAEGVPPGLGSFAHWDRKLDGMLAGSIMSIPGIKGVEIGDGFTLAEKPGSLAHDALFHEGHMTRKTNRAGGIEGGVSNGERIVVTAAMKPIPTMKKGLPSVDLKTGLAADACYIRSDVCAVAAASIVAEAVVSLCICEAFMERFYCDTLESMLQCFGIQNKHDSQGMR